MLIKICGIKDPKTALFAAANGADFIGMILTPGYARSVTLQEAHFIVEAARDGGAEPVGVFVTESPSEVEAICKILGIDTVQYYPRGVSLGSHLKRFYVNEPGVILRQGQDQLLLESENPGSGEKIDEKTFIRPEGKDFFLAGGLSLFNVKEMIAKYSPSGVDVSSGVEVKGVKNYDLILEFIRRVDMCCEFGGISSSPDVVNRDAGSVPHTPKERSTADGLLEAHQFHKNVAMRRKSGAEMNEMKFGGVYLPELLMAPIQALQKAWERYGSDTEFLEEFLQLLKDYAGRETPLTEVKRFSEAISGPRIFLKREDLLHTGAHKLNNALGQCLLAKKMGKKRIIAETGAGQHGVATATACAFLGLECVVYMGKVDVERQAPNVIKMRLLGAQIISVEKGAMTLKDAVNEALRDWSSNYEESHYCLGSALGPHPYPEMVAAFQSVIGTEAHAQMNEKIGRDPDLIVACVGGGSNAIGIFSAFIDNPKVALVGVEAGGKGDKPGEHAARFKGGRPGVLHGCHTYLLQDDSGQVIETHSVSAGLDYPAVGPQHSELYVSGRAQYVSASDDEALAAFKLLSQTEGIIPALESSHALAYVMKTAQNLSKDKVILINLSGRGEKDLPQLIEKGLLE